MLLQQENDTTGISYRTRVQVPTGADRIALTQESTLALHIGYDQDAGIRRKYKPNEDTVFVMHGVMSFTSAPSTPFVLLVVADGMGGQGHGRTASRLAVQSLVEYISDSPRLDERSTESLLSMLSAGVQHANQIVYERNQQQQTVMGTTMTAVMVIGSTAYVAHAGDSRFYLYREPMGITQLTHDHSLVAVLVADGIIAPEDIYTHPRRNIIYRSLGVEAIVEIDTSSGPLAAGDTLLVCSDGLWEMVRDRQIAAILTSPMAAPSNTAHALIEAALAGGGEDNVSVIVAQISNV